MLLAVHGFFVLQVPKENRTRYATTGLGLTSRVVGTDPTFKRLSTDDARRAYRCRMSIRQSDGGGHCIVL